MPDLTYTLNASRKEAINEIDCDWYQKELSMQMRMARYRQKGKRVMRIERTLIRNQTDQQTWQVKVSKVHELLCKVHDNED